jgi:hypothetical protein
MLFFDRGREMTFSASCEVVPFHETIYETECERVRLILGILLAAG